MVVAYLETHIFTVPATFHRTTIGNHDLEIINSMDIAVGFLGDAAMNKVVRAATINQDDDLSVLDITDELESLGAEKPVRALREMIGSTSGVSEGGIMSGISGDSGTGEMSSSSS